jgi:hypothetical protein
MLFRTPEGITDWSLSESTPFLRLSAEAHLRSAESQPRFWLDIRAGAAAQKSFTVRCRFVELQRPDATSFPARSCAICRPWKRPFSMKISLVREPATMTPAR